MGLFNLGFQAALLWRHNGRDGVSNHQSHDCLLNRSVRPRSKKTSKLRVTGLCAGNSPVTGEFPAQMASNAEKVPIWWRHHETRDYFGLKDMPCTGVWLIPGTTKTWLTSHMHIMVYIFIHSYRQNAVCKSQSWINVNLTILLFGQIFSEQYMGSDIHAGIYHNTICISYGNDFEQYLFAVLFEITDPFKC